MAIKKLKQKPMCPQCLGQNTKTTEDGGYCFDCGDDWEPVKK